MNEGPSPWVILLGVITFLVIILAATAAPVDVWAGQYRALGL